MDRGATSVANECGADEEAPFGTANYQDTRPQENLAPTVADDLGRRKTDGSGAYSALTSAGNKTLLLNANQYSRLVRIFCMVDLVGGRTPCDGGGRAERATGGAH